MDIQEKIQENMYSSEAFGAPSYDLLPSKKEAELRKAFYRKRYEADAKASLAFKNDLEDEFGVSHDHPKAKRLFDLAWEYGHSSGYNEVLNFYSDLVDLIK